MLLADELFCIAHDDRTGRPRLGARVLGIGLAAALLGELVLYQRIVIDEAVVTVMSRHPPEDPLAHTTLAQLLAEPQHRDVRTWLEFLAVTAVEAVGNRLVLAGLWRREEYRRFGRLRASYLPVDASQAVWRQVRLAHLLTGQEPMDLADAVLAALVAVTGLAGTVLWQSDSRDRGMARVAAESQRLPWSLHHLAAFTNAAVGDAALSHR